mgnify:CR=1 FL=1
MRNIARCSGRETQAASDESREDALGDLVERADAVDPVDDATGPVDLEDRGRLVLVDVQAVRDGLVGVVRTALLGRTELQPLDALLAGNVEEDDGVERLAASGQERVEMLHLGGVARVAVEEEAVRGVVLRQAIANDLAGQLVGNEVSLVEDGRDLLAERRALFDVRAEDVSGRDDRDAVRLGDADTLGAFARALRTDDEKTS